MGHAMAKLRDLLRELSLTDKHLAEMLGRDRVSISKAVAGEAKYRRIRRGILAIVAHQRLLSERHRTQIDAEIERLEQLYPIDDES